jgi:hypothetical protein
MRAKMMLIRGTPRTELRTERHADSQRPRPKLRLVRSDPTHDTLRPGTDDWFIGTMVGFLLLFALLVTIRELWRLG